MKNVEYLLEELAAFAQECEAERTKSDRWRAALEIMKEYAKSLEQDVEAERNRGDAWHEAVQELQADNEDLRGVLRQGNQQVRKERAAADYAKARAFETSEELTRMQELARDLTVEITAVRAQFDRYREYTQAGFKTLYYERRYGPAVGSPGTEETFTWRVGNGNGRRIVSYPLDNEKAPGAREGENAPGDDVSGRLPLRNDSTPLSMDIKPPTYGEK